MAFHIREAIAQDAGEVLRLRHERSEVYLKNAAVALEPVELWQPAFLHWLTRKDARILVAEGEGQIIGYMIGWIHTNLPMLRPECYGLISEMSVDGHNKQGGVGTAMFASLKDWFKANNLTYIEVRVPRLQPVEQAFWRAVGAQEQFDYLSIELD